MKRVVKFLFPNTIYTSIRSLRRYLRLGRSYIYDLNQYFRYSMSISNVAENKMIAKIMLDCHVIEKGLTMPEFRLGFGQERLAVLMDNVVQYSILFNTKNLQFLNGISVIDEYFHIHLLHGHVLGEELNCAYERVSDLKKINKLKIKVSQQKDITKKEYFKAIDLPFEVFSSSRSSVRNFSPKPVCMAKIEEALDLCRNTPSACNRQSVRVHLYTHKDEVQKILKVQGGNRGFGHLANFLILVTYESSMYFEESERNSGFVDGGMYCMNILYALHSKRVACCILNAAHSVHKDITMRKVASVPASEVFVALIACGSPPDNFKVASSFRYPLSDVLKVH